jgi:hypothetical protein
MSADDSEAVAETRNWPELVSSVYDRLRQDSDGGISVRVRDMVIQVPSRTGADAEQAHWTLDGTIDINPEEDE